MVPLDQVPAYKVVKKETRKVSRDCYVSYLGNKYSVPYKFAGRTIELHISEGKFQVYIDSESVCEHEILSGNCRVIRKNNEQVCTRIPSGPAKDHAGLGTIFSSKIAIQKINKK